MARFTIDVVKAAQIENDAALAEVMSKRRAAYQKETDPLVMMMVRGEVDKSLGRVPALADIEERVAEIKARFPKNK